ncbi:MAG: tRNA-guanine transglycosylase, partial [Candidatus Moranbacteria bacterium]|nr:tRNA-guanine transglycosylase [Candidatus Moranbacteria bacterium]
LDIGSDITVCLDDFTDPKAEKDKIKESVDRTIHWAKRSRIEFDEQIKKRKLTDKTKPKLFAVIQGGFDKELRAYCMSELQKIGFDGYGFGGYMIDEKTGLLDLEMSKYIADLIPDKYPKFALGFGKPFEIAALYEMGWDIFDCTLPTRDGRHMRLYVFKKEPKTFAGLKNQKTFGYVYINREKYRRDEKAVSEFCDCFCCKNYSRAYLHHLFNINDSLAYRLATIHNLRVYTKLVACLKKLK